ncbi:ABC transporter permease [Oharaeibacter diazotrophicus]|uniref:Amino acid ABC transporter membrane protein 2 (PAAT family) n=1 Tax=Oharaeibacter diazotrophicus TaxID=1920512 RepID=A0A4R6RID1_9HYPH|nr:ABC transporter permease [Oharaeibacter diazotrophicus]TDP86213.1 amino acid ABC transporter membrane protein 2 (PAAT family) [Oharaeibacter diazotrophicus]BBE71845.1 octopine transport system permease protein OccM [Pleomorphomonas sp. SM30]GLS78610.1 amino acid ABC transporter permease [Oharaeibacter diazotrophicus]
MSAPAGTVAAAAPPPPVRKVTRARVVGTVLLAAWGLFFLGLAALLVEGYDPEMVSRHLPRILSGVWVTVQLVVLAIGIGAAISLPVAAGRLSENPVLGALAFGYSYFFRGTPLLAQTFVVYYGAGSFAAELKSVGLWWFFRDAFNCAVFTFALNTAAYQAEILAGAIRSVPSGQWQAAAALGLHRGVTLRKVILPQALIVALRPYGNEIVLMIKGSSVAAIITVFDLMGQTRYAFSKTYDMQVYLWAALLYLAMVEVLRRIWNRLEIRLTRHLRRRTD